MGILAWIVIGLIAGLIAKAIMPGKDPGGFIATTLLGIVGAVIGGWVGQAAFSRGVEGLNFWSIFLAVVGALLCLAVYRMAVGRRRVTAH